MAYGFLVHDPKDSVGVAVEDLPAGATVRGRTLREGKTFDLTLRDAIPLGHKVALVALRRGEAVVEYGEVIGRATADIAPGAHVHVHNVASVRWPRSQATDPKVA